MEYPSELTREPGAVLWVSLYLGTIGDDVEVQPDKYRMMPMAADMFDMLGSNESLQVYPDGYSSACEVEWRLWRPEPAALEFAVLSTASLLGAAAIGGVEIKQALVKHPNPAYATTAGEQQFLVLDSTAVACRIADRIEPASGIAD